uniref:CCHC-type domain-containing protein n=1 Tax=Ananas comosus var. bracteatus TaxID=296719 RepID=A0A6V7QDL1_ANACO|nr:unnamed protein product [Ananas comosus var. bracteatus]
MLEVERRKKAVKSVAWADEVGRSLAEIKCCHDEGEVTLPASGKSSKREQKDGINVDQQKRKGTDFYHRIKKVLLRKMRPQSLVPTHQLKPNPVDQRPKRIASRSLVGKYFRCLTTDHKVAECRDPVKCISCCKLGHRAFNCKEKGLKVSSKMNRSYCQHGCISHSKVYVPYMEEFLRRELRRNAVLTDVIQSANLGLDPIRIIASAMTHHFGGYTQDIAVARYRDRDFAIFLRKCVSTESGFEIFVKVNETTKVTTDLRAFRYQIILDSLSHIP